MCLRCVMTSNNIGGFLKTLKHHKEWHMWAHCCWEGESYGAGFWLFMLSWNCDKHKFQWDLLSVTYAPLSHKIQLKWYFPDTISLISFGILPLPPLSLSEVIKISFLPKQDAIKEAILLGHKPHIKKEWGNHWNHDCPCSHFAQGWVSDTFEFGKCVFPTKHTLFWTPTSPMFYLLCFGWYLICHSIPVISASWMNLVTSPLLPHVNNQCKLVMQVCGEKNEQPIFLLMVWFRFSNWFMHQLPSLISHPPCWIWWLCCCSPTINSPKKQGSYCMVKNMCFLFYYDLMNLFFINYFVCKCNMVDMSAPRLNIKMSQLLPCC